VRKIIIAPDSFKGVLTAKEVTDIIASEVSAAFPGCEIIKMPIADGGEGSVDAIISSIGGAIHEATVLSPDDKEITAFYGIAGNKTAIIEMAQSSGITRQNGLHPMTSTTYGFGQLIISALDRGARDFMLCIGGSATTDGGCGMASALGVDFSDEQGNSFVPCGETLEKIKTIKKKDIETGNLISKSNFTVMCDVDNPLFGENGAAYIYGPQKGANPEQVQKLDKGLRHYSAVLTKTFGRDFSKAPGAGAAGGLGAGCVAFLGARLKSGIEAILNLCDFKRHITDADLVITGEGKLDSQSFQGKVLSGILRESGNIPVWSICGVKDCNDDVLREYGVKVFEASEGITPEESIKEPEKYLHIAVKKALKSISGGAPLPSGVI